MSDRRFPANRRRPDDRRSGDRRETNRLPAELTLRLLRQHEDSQRLIDGILHDASPGGVRLLLLDSIEVGDRLLIEARDSSGACLNLTAAALWIEPYVDEWIQVGCELRVDLSPRQFQLLKSLAVVDPTR